jgi:hypothetical protein
VFADRELAETQPDRVDAALARNMPAAMTGDVWVWLAFEVRHARCFRIAPALVLYGADFWQPPWNQPTRTKDSQEVLLHGDRSWIS